MEIITKKLKDIKPYGKNPRRNDEAVASVAASIEEFGWKVPLVIDKDGIIVAGHTRYKAAQRLGLEEAPCIVADDLTEEQVKHFRTLRLSPFRANSVEITLNGKKFPVIWSAPYELYVRDMLQIGKNTLKLTLTSSMRNTLGPLHTAQVEPLFVGPFSFLTEKSALDFNPPPHTEDYGFIEPGPLKIWFV